MSILVIISKYGVRKRNLKKIKFEKLANRLTSQKRYLSSSQCDGTKFQVEKFLRTTARSNQDNFNNFHFSIVLLTNLFQQSFLMKKNSKNYGIYINSFLLCFRGKVRLKVALAYIGKSLQKQEPLKR